MYLIAIYAVGFFILTFGLLRVKRLREKRELESRCIEPEALRGLLEAESEVLLFDVRQPLDVLAHSEMIPGATRVPPKDLMRDTSIIPCEVDAVIYCTCPGDKTSRAVLETIKTMRFPRVRFLKGGLEGWKARGFPVVPYRETFHLDTAS